MNYPEYLEKQLTRLKKLYDAGLTVAIYDVIYHCDKERQPLPEWAVSEIKKILIMHLSGDNPYNKGRLSPLGKYHQDMIDFARAEAVDDAKKNGISDINKFGIAHLMLNGTGAAGGEESMNRSWKRCRQNSKNEPWRYATLRAIYLPTLRRSTDEIFEQWKNEIFTNIDKK